MAHVPHVPLISVSSNGKKEKWKLPTQISGMLCKQAEGKESAPLSYEMSFTGEGHRTKRGLVLSQVLKTQAWGVSNKTLPFGQMEEFSCGTWH